MKGFRFLTLALAAAIGGFVALPSLAQDTVGATLVFPPLSPDFKPDPAVGQANFDILCKGCHNGTSLSRGPSLRGVVGRRIASVKGYEYSEALKAKSRQRWDEKTLDKFLEKPTDFAPGVRMTLWEPNPEARASMIAYLKTLK